MKFVKLILVALFAVCLFMGGCEKEKPAAPDGDTINQMQDEAEKAAEDAADAAEDAADEMPETN